MASGIESEFFVRRLYPVLLGGAIVLAGMGGGCARDAADSGGQDPQRRLNIVLIVSDAMRYDLPGCNGGSAETPNIDGLAARGVRFSQARAAAPWTMPSAVAMLTGRQAGVFLTDEPGPVTGRLNFKVPVDLETLPHNLKRQGYDLVLNAYNPNAWLAGNFQDFRRVEYQEDGRPLAAAQRDSMAVLSRVLPFNQNSSLHRRLSGCLSFLQATPPGKPFFVVNWIDDPHAPYAPERNFLKTVPTPSRDLRRRRRFYFNHSNMHIFDHFAKDSLTTAGVQHFRDLYQAEVESVDERVGLILTMLHKRGLADSTIVIFTADHGEGFNEHGLFEHGRSYYEELLHVPLIISGPGLPEGAVVDDPVALLDLMATVQGLLGVSGPDKVSRQGFLAAVVGKPYTPDSFYFDSATDLAGNDCRDALWQDDFKLITHHEVAKVELYNLESDPGEALNLASEQPERVGRMLESLAGLRQTCLGQRTHLAGRRGSPVDSTVTAADRQKILDKLKSLGYVK